MDRKPMLDYLRIVAVVVQVSVDTAEVVGPWDRFSAEKGMVAGRLSLAEVDTEVAVATGPVLAVALDYIRWANHHQFHSACAPVEDSLHVGVPVKVVEGVVAAYHLAFRSAYPAASKSLFVYELGS